MCEFVVSENFLKLTNLICEEYINNSDVHLYSGDTTNKNKIHRVTRHLLNCCKTPTMKLSFVGRIADADHRGVDTLFSSFGDDGGEQFSFVLHSIFDSMFYSDDTKKLFNVNWGRIVVMFHYTSIALHKQLNLTSKKKNNKNNVELLAKMKKNCVSILQNYFLSNSDLCRWIEKTKGGWDSIV